MDEGVGTGRSAHNVDLSATCSEFNSFLECLQNIYSGSYKVSPDTIAIIYYIAEAVVLLFGTYLAYRLVYVPFFEDFLLAEKCRFHLENTEPLKVGDTVVYTISGFLSPATTDNSKTAIYTQNFFNALTAKITHNNERMPVMKAYAVEENGRIKMMFTADKSGTYNLDIRYNGFVIPGSPMLIIVPPDFMSASHSDIICPSTPVLITDGMPQTIQILPRDRTGFPCGEEGVRLDKFDFHASTEKPRCCSDVSFKCGKMHELIGSNQKEVLDASFTYGESSVGGDRSGNCITVLLNLRTNRSPNAYGIFEGQVCYDGTVLRNGCFPIVSLTADEYERLEPTIKDPKPTNVIQLRAEVLLPKIMLTETACSSKNNENIKENNDQGQALPDAEKEREQENSEASSSLMDWCWTDEDKAMSHRTGKFVHINVTMNYICVKETLWTVLQTTTAMFPIQCGIKIDIVPETAEQEKYVVTLSDDSLNEAKVLMSASNTRILMALYYKYRAIDVELRRV